MVSSDLALTTLRQIFGFHDFRPGQAEVIDGQLQGRDVLSVAPTGSGKSVSYWIPALVGEGLTLVVSPLIALMKDQVDKLRQAGVAAACVNSSMERADQVLALQAAARGEVKLLYLAPERFGRPGFLNRLTGLAVGRMVVDEAHCISTWGHDFRPDYRRLGEALAACGRPPVAAFTATATPLVRDDIVASLGLRSPLVSVTGFQRSNLELSVVRCRGDREKLEKLRGRLDPGSGRAIIYTGTVAAADELAAAAREWGHSAVAYHGRLGDERRRRAQAEFSDGRAKVVVATSAFGMGIDLPDIRQVVHHQIPGSLEAYYQEAGRAGRDGQPASCVLLYSPADRDLQSFFIERGLPEMADVLAIYRALARIGAWSVDPEDLRASLDERAFRALDASRSLLHAAGVFQADGGIARVAALDVDFDQLARLKRHAYDRLAQMLGYAEQRGCRHARIANYFGEEGVAKTCPACDNCLAQRGPETVVEPAAVGAALACLARFSGRVGAVNQTAVLRGRDNKWTRSQGWVRALPFFGALASWPEDRVRGLLGELVAGGYAVQSTDQYPVLEISPQGRQVLAGRARAEVTLPIESVTPPPPPDDDLLANLKRWRTVTAAAEGVAAYMVFADRTLAELAGRRPQDQASLLAVAGIGPAKLARYGDALLGLLTVPPPDRGEGREGGLSTTGHHDHWH